MNRTLVTCLICAALSVLGAGIALIVGELVARSLAPQQEANRYVFDPLLGHRRPTSFSGTYQTAEFSNQVHYNSSGFRDVERTKERTPKSFRIAVLGDSYIEGIQVPLSSCMTQQLEQQLADWIPERKIEVLNFGISGYGTLQEYLLLKNEVLQYRPDVVLLGFLTGNDVRNNSLALDQATRDYSKAQRPYLESGKAGFALRPPSIQAKLSFERTGWKYLLFDSSALLRTIHARARQVEWLATAMVRAGLLAPSTFHLLHGIPTDYQIYLTDQDADWQNAWEVTSEVLRQMKLLLEQQQVAFMVLSLTNREQIYSEDWEAILKSYPAMLTKQWDLNQPSQKLSAILMQLGIKEIKLIDHFRDFSQQPGAPRLHYRLDGHWTAAGHVLAAQYVARSLRAGAVHD